MVPMCAIHDQCDPGINGHPLGTHIETVTILAAGPLCYLLPVFEVGLLYGYSSENTLHNTPTIPFLGPDFSGPLFYYGDRTHKSNQNTT